MKITKNIISREDAIKLVPDYVNWIDFQDQLGGNQEQFDLDEKLDSVFSQLKRGQSVITYLDGVFIRAKVSSVKNDDIRAVDGPVIRVTNGEFSWRVDGDRYAYPL